MQHLILTITFHPGGVEVKSMCGQSSTSQSYGDSYSAFPGNWHGCNLCWEQWCHNRIQELQRARVTLLDFAESEARLEDFDRTQRVKDAALRLDGNHS